ncbi:MAG: hypothetical protein QOI09_1233 [Chloroflexota bacterium]|nr:hypothetical protein [Chloroflexota bacterium]
MNDQRPFSDDLFERIRRRVADPARRVDQRPSSFQAGVASLDVGQLFDQLRGARSDLDRVVEANRAGIVDPATHARAQQIGAAMQAPLETDLPLPATDEVLDRAQARIGFDLPLALRQLYGRIADGGFGPGPGLLSIDRVADRFLAVQAEVPPTQRWPPRLLPIVDHDAVLDCIDAATGNGPVVAWDPDGLSERAGDRTWQRSFTERAPSLEAWLEGWLNATSHEDRMQEVMRKAKIDSARQSRAWFAAMTPEQRASYGLPEVGWERQIAGGLGLDDDEA